jgi:hypothetical protein
LLTGGTTRTPSSASTPRCCAAARSNATSAVPLTPPLQFSI